MYAFVVSPNVAFLINLGMSQVVMALGQRMFENTSELQIANRFHSIISRRWYVHKRIISAHQKGLDFF